MNIRIESATGLVLMNADCGSKISYRFAAQCFQECEREPGCPDPYRIVIDGTDEYFAEDVSWMLEED